MSRPIGSKNAKKLPKIMLADETERLEYIAALLLEIVEDELQCKEVETCNPTS